MGLRPQDLVVALRLALGPSESYPALAAALGLSLSEAHGAVKRASAAGLLSGDRQADHSAILEFMIHGAKYVFYAKRGRMTRGMPTAHGAPPLSNLIAAGSDPVPVWPDSAGTVRGEALEPLYKSVPAAAKKDAKLYEVLSLFDAVRCGRARERKLAEGRLREILAS